VLPLRAFLYSGLFISFLCGLYAIFLLLIYFVKFQGYQTYLPPGWVSLALAIVFFSSVQLVGIGIIGEYLGRVYAQVKQRPDFIVREKGI